MTTDPFSGIDLSRDYTMDGVGQIMDETRIFKVLKEYTIEKMRNENLKPGLTEEQIHKRILYDILTEQGVERGSDGKKKPFVMTRSEFDDLYDELCKKFDGFQDLVEKEISEISSILYAAIEFPDERIEYTGANSEDGEWEHMFALDDVYVSCEEE